MRNVPKLTWSLAAIAVFLFGNFVFIACTKETTAPVARKKSIEDISTEKLDLKSLVSMEDGVLVFKNSDDMKRVYDYISTLNVSSTLISETFKEFVSAQMAYEKVSKIASQRSVEQKEYENIAYWSGSGEDMTFKPVISNPLYAKLFNKNGLVKVGDYCVKHIDANTLFYYPSHIDLEKIGVMKPIRVIKLNTGARERANCSTVYAWSNGYQWKKVEGESLITLDPITFNPIPGGPLLYVSRSFKRGFLGRWYLHADPNIEVGVEGPFGRFSEFDVDTFFHMYNGVGVICFADFGTCGPI